MPVDTILGQVTAHLPQTSAADSQVVRGAQRFNFVSTLGEGDKEMVVGAQSYDVASERDRFHYLMNIESYPDFLPHARAIVDQHLTEATRKLNNPAQELPPNLHRFDFSHQDFNRRLQQLYEDYAAETAARLKPGTEQYDQHNKIWSLDRLIQRLIQFSPFNLTDGAWLQNVTKTGPITRVQGLLFSIWADEVGGGKDSANHPNIYRDLLNSVSIYLPSVHSRAFCDDPRFLTSAFTNPVFQLAISQHTAAFFPEIIGMTLFLEWTTPPQMQLLVNILSKNGLNPHFYSLHVGIDNPVKGHGALAKEIVQLYLDEERSRSGDEGMQAVWQRIWTGFVAFSTTGQFGDELLDLLDKPRTPRERLVSVIEKYSSFARLMHGDRTLVDPGTGKPRPINDWFQRSEISGLLDAIIRNGLVIPGDPKKSRFFEVTPMNGPMFRVFSDEDIDLFKEWIMSLSPPAISSVTSPEGVVSRMAQLIDTCRSLVSSGQASINLDVSLAGIDPKDSASNIERPLRWWLDETNADTSQVLIALANDSRFVDRNEIAESASRLTQLFGVAASETVTEWVRQGAPTTGSTGKVSNFALFLDTEVSRSAESNRSRRRILGMGANH